MNTIGATSAVAAMRQAVRFVDSIHTVYNPLGWRTPKQWIEEIMEFKPEQYRGIWLVPYRDCLTPCVSFGCWHIDYAVAPVRGLWAAFSELYTADLCNAGDNIEDAVSNARKTIDRALESHIVVQQEDCPPDEPLTESERAALEKRLETLCSSDVERTYKFVRELSGLAIQLKLGLRPLYKEEED